MKMEKITVKTTKRIELINVTEKVQETVDKNKIKDGLCFVFCPHTTAGLTLNENADPSVKQDIISALNKIIPENEGYLHGEGNADSHIKSSIFGSSLTIFVEQGELLLGAWQGVYFCESDGPRSREMWIKIISNIKD